VVTTVLNDPGRHIGQVYELTGPQTLDMTEVAEEFSCGLGRRVSYVDVPPEAWAERLAAGQELPAHVREHIATMARLHRGNRYDQPTRTVEQITGSPAQTVEQFVAQRAAMYTR
jgi:uncharacterized protein YbjT (DUF2867 family)